MNCGLRGRNVLVTGGATGIALANARAFLAEGVHAPFGVAATGMACDLSDPDQAVVLADLARASLRASRAPQTVLDAALLDVDAWLAAPATGERGRRDGAGDGPTNGTATS